MAQHVEKFKSVVENSPKPKVKLLNPDLIAALVCFVITIAVCLLQNLSRAAQELTLVFDAGHYLGSCQKICTIWQTYIHHGAISAQTFSQLQDDLMLDGPVLPFVGSLTFIILGHIPTYTDSAAIVVMQAVLQALSAFLIYFLAKNFTGSWRWSSLCAILWGTYPAAVIGAGRLLPETITCLILVALVLVLSYAYTCSARATNLLTALGGAFSSLVLLVKPALGPAAFVIDILFLAFFQDAKKIFTYGALLVLGGVIAISPWMVFTKITTGEAMMTAQRVPVFNIVNGLDQESNGWAAIPPSKFVGLFAESSGAWPSFVSIVKAQPEATVKMVVQKIPRLWQVPFNDFRSRFFGINAGYQIWWHQILCLFGLMGMLAFFLAPGVNLLTTKLPAQKAFAFVGYASTAFILGHLVYIVFLSAARYGFTAMPFYVLFAGFAFMKLAQSKARLKVLRLSAFALSLLWLWQTDLVPYLAEALGAEADLKWLAVSIQLALTLLALILSYKLFASIQFTRGQKSGFTGKIAFALAFVIFSSIWIARATDSMAPNEWSSKLPPNESACRRIFPAITDSAHKAKPDWALVAFDGDETSGDAQVAVNGKVIEQKPESLYLFNSANSGYSQFQLFSALLRTPSSKLRQWRAVQVPLGYLNLKGDNILSIQPGPQGKATIFGSYPVNRDGAWNIPSLFLFSPTKLVNSTTTFENRPIAVDLLKSKDSLSWLQKHEGSYNFDLSYAPGWQFGQYRILLLTGYAKQGISTPQISPQETKPEVIALTPKPITVGATPQVFRFDIPPSVRKLGHIAIKVSGALSSPKAANRATILGTISEGGTSVYFVPGSPLTVNFDNKPANFSLKGYIHCATDKNAVDVIELTFTSQIPGAEIRDLKVILQPAKLADFADHDIRVL